MPQTVAVTKSACARQPKPSPSRWKTVNTWGGYLVFGLPAALAIPALISTLKQFGPLDTLTSAVPAALGACVPVLLWIRYNRKPPRTRTGKLTWALLAVIATATLVFSPLFFWAGPALLVLASEALRALLSARTEHSLLGPSQVNQQTRAPRPESSWSP